MGSRGGLGGRNRPGGGGGSFSGVGPRRGAMPPPPGLDYSGYSGGTGSVSTGGGREQGGRSASLSSPRGDGRGQGLGRSVAGSPAGRPHRGSGGSTNSGFARRSVSQLEAIREENQNQT